MRNLSLIVFSAVAVFILAACDDGTKSMNSASTPSPQISPNPSPSPSESQTVSLKVDPERLIAIIKQLQTEYVRDSIGVEAHECFTDDDFNQFISNKKTVEIVERLHKDNDFGNLVNAIRDLNSDSRSNLLNRALNTYRRTWSELHLNPNSASADELRKGQTRGGMQAEKLIAQTVVDLVRQMLSSRAI
jgi:hypothetical protein